MSIKTPQSLPTENVDGLSPDDLIEFYNSITLQNEKIKHSNFRGKTKVLWTGPLSVVSTPTSLDGGEKFSDWDLILFVGNLLSDAAVNRGTSNTLTQSLFSGTTSLLFSDEGRFEIVRLSDTSFEIIVKEQVAANLHTIIGISL